jgi:hypothetical protein
MALDVNAIAQAMGKALFDSLKTSVPDIKEYATQEAKKFAQSLAMIEALKVAGKITEQEAQLHLDIQKNASRMVLLTVKGLGAVAVESALNAALGVVKQAVNTAVGFALV